MYLRLYVFFCNLKRKYKGRYEIKILGSSEALDAEDNIKEAVRILDDQEMLTKIGCIYFLPKKSSITIVAERITRIRL